MSDEPDDGGDMEAVERDWVEFWRPIVAPNGWVDYAQVKRELYDFHIAMQEVSKVYDALTGGEISKITTTAQWVIDAANRHYAQHGGDGD